MTMFYRRLTEKINMARTEEAIHACCLEGLYADMMHLTNRKLGYALLERGGGSVWPQVVFEHVLESSVFGQTNMTACWLIM